MSYGGGALLPIGAATTDVRAWDAPPAGREPRTPYRAAVSWEPAVERFLADKRRTNCSAGTIENYRTHLLGPRVVGFLRASGIARVDQFEGLHLRGFELGIADSGLSPGSVATYHRILRNFLGWCRRHGYDAPVDVTDVEGPREPVREPATITAAQELELLAAARCERDQFLIRFMLATGLRRSEVAAVTVDDLVELDSGQRVVRVRQGKGRKDRLVPLVTTPGSDMVRATERYLRDVRPVCTSRALFVTVRAGSGSDGAYMALASQSIKTIFRRLESATGIEVHAHTLRHTAASRWIAGGVNPMAVQRALGHTTMAMTTRYVHFDHTGLVEAFALPSRAVR